MSKLKEKLDSGKFTITAEIGPPKGSDVSEFREIVKLLKGKIDAFNVTDGQGASMKLSSLAGCLVILSEGEEPVMQMTGRDRNRIAIQSELLGAYALGIRNILAITGDYPTLGDNPGAKPVYDLDSVGILLAASSLMKGRDLAGNLLKGEPPNFYLGATANPNFFPIEVELIKMEKKIEAGARFFQTQAVYDINVAERFMKEVSNFNIKVLLGIIPLRSLKSAQFVSKMIPGVKISEEVLRRMENASDPKIEGLKIAAELIRKVKEHGLAHGVHIMAIGAEKTVPILLDML
ncbi:MAG: methylenetetrahydrofolate reductase [Synergistetes bacterium]|nr:methylenetetrahydrofolate reductase [Synergistota bacterium]MCX8127438.1 methylenetetrahydrofolate reductase [Synergistota bacterium]MDW8192302.1 methylenetetrahydrofolate reductase [Synergistota bacterium]